MGSPNEYVYVDYFSIKNSGHVLVPSYAGGTNYALGGATTRSHFGFLNTSIIPDGLPPALLPFITNGKEQAELIIHKSAHDLDSEALYIVAIGVNNLTFAAEKSASIIEDPLALEEWGNVKLSEALSDIQDIIDDLYAAGAEHIVLSNSFDVGRLPFISQINLITPGVSDFATLLTQNFNSGLLQIKNESLADIFLLDVYDIVNEAIEIPNINNHDSCYDGMLTICHNPDKYVFWDDLHLSSAVHKKISRNLLKMIYFNKNKRLDRHHESGGEVVKSGNSDNVHQLPIIDTTFRYMPYKKLLSK